MKFDLPLAKRGIVEDNPVVNNRNVVFIVLDAEKQFMKNKDVKILSRVLI